MYLIDTNVISETRKGKRTNSGVREFEARVQREGIRLYMSAITVSESRRGADMIRHRGDAAQAVQLDEWLAWLLNSYAGNIFGFDSDTA